MASSSFSSPSDRGENVTAWGKERREKTAFLPSSVLMSKTKGSKTSYVYEKTQQRPGLEERNSPALVSQRKLTKDNKVKAWANPSAAETRFFMSRDLARPGEKEFVFLKGSFFSIFWPKHTRVMPIDDF